MTIEEIVQDLRGGVQELASAVTDLGKFATRMDETALDGMNEDEQAILRRCEQINQSDSAVSRLLHIQSRCHETAKKIYAFPLYEWQARYCVETSLQAAEFETNIGGLGYWMGDGIRKLRDREDRLIRGKWNEGDESEFWRSHYRFDHIAAQHASQPSVPDLGESVRPVLEDSDPDRVLKDYLEQLERMPKHCWAIVNRLDKMSKEMVHKYYHNQTWYRDAIRE